MAKNSSTPNASTPATLKKANSSAGQKSIHSFFSKTPNATQVVNLPERSSPRKALGSKPNFNRVTLPRDLTPVPSSDAREPEIQEDEDAQQVENGSGTPSRRAKSKRINYVESGSEGTDNDEIFKSRPAARKPPVKRRKLSESADEDVYEQENDVEDDLDDFIVPDDSDEEVKPAKRKRSSKPTSRKRSPDIEEDEPELKPDIDMGIDVPGTSTAQQWKFDPENPQPLQPRSVNLPSKKPGGTKKPKAHMTEPSERYPWLEEIQDLDRHPKGHPDYDPRTLYIPPIAWQKFSPFEKQYWEIKQKFWDTIVFFKKGKFYELYENDATIGHQLFDLKLTDRVNMRMVGVPESSLEMWANQFVAKGFKIARVDQQETALGKDMRERDEKDGSSKKGTKEQIIRRELACVLTAGTLVDGAMLQDDMSTWCVSIKESEINDMPAFGIAFVDTATGQFHVTEFVDDSDLTRFETFVAQTRPQELLLEKGGLSVKTLRILKNNTGPTTIWNYLKPGKEFWEGHITIKEIEASNYFPQQWPKVLEESKDKDLMMSAVGGLIWYLRSLKIEHNLVTMGKFEAYDPIKKATSLVLDGQTLINLEVFTNSFDGGVDGTLFQLLNRCVTPFGKRLFKQWVCHPLMDTKKINARLDAVDSLNADHKTRDRFTVQMGRMPDLERLISRIHAGSCKAQDFVRVLEGFEQIEHTISLLKEGHGKTTENQGVIGQLVSAMPELRDRLAYWHKAFDREKAKEVGILVPERGVEEDFDESQDYIESIQKGFDDILNKWRKQLGSSAICYRDNGKEIMQMEVPIKVASKVPKDWDQMSATKQVKRYYFQALRKQVRELQEAQETHSKIVKDVAGRFYARFDEDYEVWLAAVKIIAQLDCLISLAKASTSLGQPACRPQFVHEERSVLELKDLRHPCLLDKVDDFIPNDIELGGDIANITLLTGANAAGKSTVLRMTCIAVIMAQIGCYVPCESARLTPVDRIMSRLGAQDHIFAAQSTFFVELAETKKILTEATPRSLVILDELGRGTSSHDGVAVAQAVLHHLASHIGCIGFFATHYHSLGAEFRYHPEVVSKRMQILVDDEERRVTFLYKLEDGVAEGSFGMHCAAMCGISKGVINRAEEAAHEWEHTSRISQKLKVKEEEGSEGQALPLGILSDIAAVLQGGEVDTGNDSVNALLRSIEAL
ncbi:DNA mismatch repair protein msh6 [Neophaeococcomyces mojaviensis]|uniref:DNA mismatch repair protein msh6 n=1 Tax=Neophaeococcomyces mojaviensis TaxID=3383035 RepID=A0ACC2ZXY7_9EURO|nr:DNA mismatch repair protein msh6 [Knufia sp. JES_112]